MPGRLADTLVPEAEAYGYTLTVWGAGGVVIHRFGPPGYWEVVGFAATVAYNGLLQAERLVPERLS